MLKISKNKPFKSIVKASGISESIMSMHILNKFTKTGIIENNYLEHEIDEFIKYLFEVHIDYMLMLNELIEYRELFNKIEIYETES